MRISDWSSDVCSSDLCTQPFGAAAPAGEIKVVKFGYADLNLDSESGLARLDSRLRAAARSVCDVRPEIETTLREMATSRCFRSALSRGRDASRDVIAAAKAGEPMAVASTIIIARP